MYLFFLKIRMYFRDIFYYIGKTIKRIFYGVIELFSMAFNTLFGMLHRLLKRMYGFTEIGFIVGIVLLGFNIRECIVTDNEFYITRFFTPMLWLIGVHVLVFIGCKILSKLDI